MSISAKARLPFSFTEMELSLEYRVGTMIEIPWAALIANEVVLGFRAIGRGYLLSSVDAFFINVHDL